MASKLVCYSVAGLTPVQHMKFQKEMYGYNDRSNKGKYFYRRKGVTNMIKCRKIFNGILITNEKGLNAIKKVLRKHKVKNRVFNVL